MYLNALWGEGVHVVTVNDYLAKRDSEWMGQVYRFLGMAIGMIQAQMAPDRTPPAYAADVTYGTNNEFGFDYLRDNMVTEHESLAQRGHFFAIVDEVDSILIDEARTPLIISGAVQESTKWYSSSLASPPDSSPTTTTRSTRRSARSRSPKRVFRRSSRSWASTTSTTT